MLVRMLKTVKGDGDYPVVAYNEMVYEATWNQHGAVSIEFKEGPLGITPDEFKVEGKPPSDYLSAKEHGERVAGNKLKDQTKSYNSKWKMIETPKLDHMCTKCRVIHSGEDCPVCILQDDVSDLQSLISKMATMVLGKIK